MFCLLVILSKQSNDCDPNEILDDSLICCNYSICNQYCYKDICIKPRKVWFCHQEGIRYLFIIKSIPSLIFTLFGMFVRLFCYKQKKLAVFFCRSITEFIFNATLFTMINGYSCLHDDGWGFLAVFCTLLICAWVCLLYLFSPFYKDPETIAYLNLSIDNLDNIKSLRNFINKFRNVCIVIFGLTGYYMVFDTFAYALNKRYRNDFDAIK